jgi:hypothetical protein
VLGSSSDEHSGLLSVDVAEALAEADFFLTRDEGLLRAGDAIRAEYGIQILRPDQVIVELDRGRRHGLYEPVALQGTEIVRSRLRGTEDREFAEALSEADFWPELACRVIEAALKLNPKAIAVALAQLIDE